MTTATKPPPITSATPEWVVLSRALADLVAADRQTPCADGTGRWTSEEPDARAEAATACQRCPLLAPCAAAAASTRERFGTWGGRDRTRKARAERETA